MKTKSAPAVNTKYVALFAAACASASQMGKACEALARAIIGTGRGKDAYTDAVKELAALETASTDGNKHTVRRYASESLAILAQVGRKATISDVARERTEKAQTARKALGIKKRGTKKAKKAKGAKPAAKPADFEAAYRAMVKLAAGRASLISWAKAEGFDLVFSMRIVTGQTSVPSDAPKANGTKPPKGTRRQQPQAAAH